MENEPYEGTKFNYPFKSKVKPGTISTVGGFIIMLIVAIVLVWFPRDPNKKLFIEDPDDGFQEKTGEIENKEKNTANTLGLPKNTSFLEKTENANSIKEFQSLRSKDPQNYRINLRGIATKDKLQYRRLAVNKSAYLIELIIDSRLHLAMAMSYLFDTKEQELAKNQIVLVDHFLDRARPSTSKNTQTLIDKIRKELGDLQVAVESKNSNLKKKFEKVKFQIEDLLIETFKRINDFRGEQVMPASRQELSIY